MHAVTASLLSVFCFLLVRGGILDPGWNSDPLKIKELVLPNRRESYSDCYYRFYKYGRTYQVKPSMGRPTYLREFAHMAAIGWTQEDSTIKWNCGGSLIWENYILTAAHCAADSNNNLPDVARFADLHLFNHSDDQYAQQLKIVEIIRHPEHSFRARYHDIALMRLEHKVQLHDTVAPACLWTDDEIRFKTLEATGWGDTGFAEARTPLLLKVTLTPVEKERCNSSYRNLRGLRYGLHANQMCAGDEVMDTCPGDSGGPLQVKLLHNTRVTPFVVGVTSFGKACGQSEPGVYTRVAPYVPWIRSVLNERGENATENKFTPQSCALRYLEYREFEPQIILHIYNNTEQLDFSQAHIFQQSSYQMVTIYWNGTEESECFGVILDETTVVTLARCTSKNGVSPSYVKYYGERTNAVIRRYKNPLWTTGSLYGDVGLLILKDAIKFSRTFYPACIWDRAELDESKFEVSGQGLLELNMMGERESGNETLEESAALNRTATLLGIIDVHTGTNCSLPQRETSQRFTNGLSPEHLCFGAEPFVVPGTCHLALGGPIQRELMPAHRILMFVFALNLFGRDCGFGESAIGVQLSSHLPWIDSVLLPQVDEERRNPIIFLNDNLIEGDSCNGGEGVCINAEDCPKILHDHRQNRRIQFCQRASLLCCPRQHIRNESDADWREIDNCANNPLFTSAASYPNYHFVNVLLTEAQENDEPRQTCAGTMIASRTFVTAASCLGIHVAPIYVSMSHTEIPMTSYLTIAKTIVHPEYDSITKLHNIALVKTLNRVDTFFEKVPVCLWSNATHTPFHLDQVMETETESVGQILAFTKFNSDCQLLFKRSLEPYDLCLDMNYPERYNSDEEETGPVVAEGTPVFWRRQDSKTGGAIHFLIGIASHSSPNDTSVFLHTRIASYVSWIKSVL